MKLFAIFLAVFFSFNWFGGDFKILDARSQEYAGGRERSGYGTRYTIKLLAKKKSKKLKITEVWVGKDYFEVQPVKDFKHRNDHSFAKNDTIYLYFKKHIHTDERMKESDEKYKKHKEAPYQFKSAALIGYMYKNKKQYKEVDSFQRLEKVFYP